MPSSKGREETYFLFGGQDRRPLIQPLLQPVLFGYDLNILMIGYSTANVLLINVFMCQFYKFHTPLPP